MDSHREAATGEFGQLAFGRSHCWEITIDESLRGRQYHMQIEGSSFYLDFQLPTLGVVRQALEFFEGVVEAVPLPDGAFHPDNRLLIGHFGTASVSLVRDVEFLARTFLVIAQEGQGTGVIHVTFDANDASALAEALRQVVADLTPDDE